MIFAQKTQLKAALEQNRPLRRQPRPPREDFVLRSHSVFKPFARYSDRLLGQIQRFATR
jgi:hypothetical protein